MADVERAIKPGSRRARPIAKPKQSSPTTSAAGLAKAAAVGVAAGTLISSRLIDLALIGSAIATAVGSVVFAGVMVAEGDHPPWVNGVQYLAIYSQPSGAVRHAAATAAAPAQEPTPAPSHETTQESPQSPIAEVSKPGGVDMTPTGSIAKAPNGPPFQLVSADADRAWVRSGSRIFAVHPGDKVADLGEVAAIKWEDGRWTLANAKGAVLLAGGEAAAPKPPAATPFAERRMIFGP